MLKIIQSGNAMPASYPVDITSTFQPGQICQLKLIGNDIVMGLSDGTAPIGIIDDIKTSAFTMSVYDEIAVIPGLDITTDGYNYYTGRDSMKTLRNAGLIRSSFLSDYEGLILNEVNGVVKILAGSRLNWDSDGDHKNDSVKTIVNYVYQIGALPGDDTTIGSNRLTFWFQRAIFATDMFDTLQRYPMNVTLFVNEEGKLTSRQLTANHPGVAILTAPPSAVHGTIEFLWL